MPEKETIERAHHDKEQGKSPSTQAGEFVREEFEHIREGKHGARSPQQAIAIGLSKARRAGVKLPPNPSTGRAERPRGRRKPSARRSAATRNALRREGSRAGSRSEIAKQTRASARRRGQGARHRAAMKAVRTKRKEGLRRAARKAAASR